MVGRILHYKAVDCKRIPAKSQRTVVSLNSYLSNEILYLHWRFQNCSEESALIPDSFFFLASIDAIAHPCVYGALPQASLVLMENDGDCFQLCLSQRLHLEEHSEFPQVYTTKFTGINNIVSHCLESIFKFKVHCKIY